MGNVGSVLYSFYNYIFRIKVYGRAGFYFKQIQFILTALGRKGYLTLIQAIAFIKISVGVYAIDTLFFDRSRQFSHLTDHYTTIRMICQVSKAKTVIREAITRREIINGFTEKTSFTTDTV